ncbi:MAG: LysM peptidoglycan-binding domain-containing protein [Firmicutes bacterium]|nr:LysM peptidoglycan-binding domain-containing protein [Bacillota bacterium]
MALWTHDVRPGETLSGLAIEYNSSVPEIVRASGLPNPNWIIPGQKLLIPSPDFAYPREEINLWARLLLIAYAAPLSELTAITQYSYQQVVWDNLTAKEVLLRISLDETEHLNTIAQILKNLGVEPRYWVWEQEPVYWNAALVNYSTVPREILQADIHSEYHAVQSYRELINHIPERFIRGRISHILSEEERHIKEFENLLNNLGR